MVIIVVCVVLDQRIACKSLSTALENSPHYLSDATRYEDL